MAKNKTTIYLFSVVIFKFCLKERGFFVPCVFPDNFSCWNQSWGLQPKVLLGTSLAAVTMILRVTFSSTLFNHLYFTYAIPGFCIILVVYVSIWQQRRHRGYEFGIPKCVTTHRLGTVHPSNTFCCSGSHSQEGFIEASRWWDSFRMLAAAAGGRPPIRHWLQTSCMDCMCLGPKG